MGAFTESIFQLVTEVHELKKSVDECERVLRQRSGRDATSMEAVASDLCADATLYDMEGIIRTVDRCVMIANKQARRIRQARMLIEQERAN